MDVTTLALAVDSSQVNTASTALQKMAAEGFKAETVVAKLANTAQLQGRALNSGIVKNAAAAADSIRGLTGATSALAGAQDFSRTTAGLSAAAAQANAATGAVRAFGAAVAATAAASLDFSASPAQRAATVQQIAQAPVSVLARSAQSVGAAPVGDIDSKGAVTATNALDRFADQSAKAKSAAENLTSAAQEQGRVLGAGVAPGAEKAAGAMRDFATAASVGGAAAGITSTSSALSQAATQANAAAAAMGNMKAQAARSGGNFNPFGSLGNAAKPVEDLGKAAKLTAFQTQQLSYQLNDLFVQVASGQSPLTALIQQGSQLNGTFGGTKGTLQAVASLFTPMRVAIGGAAASIGALAYAYMEGAAQSKAFNDAIILSGNYAGQTQGQVNALAATVAESTKTSVGSVREFANALISTGQIGPQAMALATDAVVRYGEATGKTAQEAAADFAKMARDPAKFAQELNQSWNAFTAAELEAIQAMQEGGDVGGAQIEVLKRMQERLEGLHQNLGDVERVGRTFSKMLGDLKDGFFAIGRDRTLEDRLQKLQGIFDRTDTSGFLSKINEALGVGSEKRQNFFAGGNAKEQQESLLAQQAKERKEVEEKAAKAAAEKRDTEADKVIKPLLKAGKAKSEYEDEKKKLDAAFKAKADNGREVSKEDQSVAYAQLKKRFTPAKSAGSNEAAQVMREQLGEDLSAIKAALDAEKQALEFQQRYVQGVYQAGGISLKDFYNEKRETIAAGVAAEQAELDKEIARLEQYRDQIKDPSEKVKTQKQIGQVKAQKEKLDTQAARDVQLANQEEAASFKALNDQIINYNANLLQMAGDELGAARLRAQVAVDNARILAAQGAKDAAGNPVKVDVSALQQAIQTANEFADVQRQAGLLAASTARAEEAAFMAAEQGGKSLAEQENAVYAVRSRALDQLGLLAQKARELAEASTDPKIKQFAADLALQYAKAAEAVDPPLNRLREAQRNLASGITGSIDNGIANFGTAYADERKQSREAVKTQKDELDRKISQLQSYLAQSADANDKARLREKIKNLESQRDNVKGESTGKSALNTINKSILQPIAGQSLATINKLLVTDPLNEYLKGQFKKLSEGDGLFAGFFKDALGIKDAKVDPKVLAEQAAATATDALANSVKAQTEAADASTTALNALANAANAAGGTVGNAKPLEVTPGDKQVIPSMGDFTRADRALTASLNADGTQAAADSQAKAADSANALSKTSAAAASDVLRLAQAASDGGSALSRMPGLVGQIGAVISSLVATGGSSAGSGGGVLGSIINAGISYFTSSPLQVETVASGAVSADFKEMPNFLRGGRELGGPVSANSLYRVNERGPEMLEMDGKQYLMTGPQGGKVISNGSLLARANAANAADSVSSIIANIAGGKDKPIGESSADVLGGLLSRLGVKDEDHTRSGVLKVAGARELGGPVSAGKLYRVNEKRPELLNVGNKQYLMMGGQGGSVDANPQQGKGGAPINQTINFVSQGVPDRRTQAQLANAAYSGGMRAKARIG